MKGSSDLLSSILKTTQMGQVGIRAVLRAELNPHLRKALHDQLAEYDKLEYEAHVIAQQKGWELEELNPLVKKMSTMMTKSRLSFGFVDSKAAAMMINGNTRGMIKSLKNLNHYDHSDPAIEELAKKLLKCEENNIRQVQEFV